MDENRRSMSSSAPYLPPKISIPASSTLDNMFAVGGGGTGESPGPMTLLSNFMSENDRESDYRSFSQLLAGTISSSAEIPGRIPPPDLDSVASFTENAGGGGTRCVDFPYSTAGRPSVLAVTQASMFTIPPGLSPATLLNSPEFIPSAQVLHSESN